MINEFSCSPKPQNNNAKIACGMAMGIFAVFAVVYALIDKYKGIVGLICIGFLTAGLYIYTKYMSGKYYYDITLGSDNTGLFIVRRVVGKRQSTHLVIQIADIVDVKKEVRSEKKTEKPAAKTARYFFTPTFMPEVTYKIIVKNRYENGEVVIECSEEFAELLCTYAKEERERLSLEDDEY